MRFFAVPAWMIADGKVPATAPAEGLVPNIPTDPTLVTDALARIEYRGFKALDRAQELIEQNRGNAVYAKSPNDLPALLRTADQLLLMKQREAGESAQVWRCACGYRYAVPVSLLRTASIRCERCERTIDLDPHIAGSQPLDPRLALVNDVRQVLADFFREAMARGWPVIVANA